MSNQAIKVTKEEALAFILSKPATYVRTCAERIIHDLGDERGVSMKYEITRDNILGDMLTTCAWTIDPFTRQSIQVFWNYRTPLLVNGKSRGRRTKMMRMAFVQGKRAKVGRAISKIWGVLDSFKRYPDYLATFERTWKSDAAPVL